MKTFHDQIADFITEQEKHNPRTILEYGRPSLAVNAADERKKQERWRNADEAAFRNLLIAGDKAETGKWIKFFAPDTGFPHAKTVAKFKKAAEQKFRDMGNYGYRKEAEYTYVSKSGHQTLSDVYVVIGINMNSISRVSARILVYSPEHPEGKSFTIDNEKDAAKFANDTVKARLKAGHTGGVPVTCPHCGEDFMMDAADVMKKRG